MDYADLTIRDRNPIKRWLQHRRFADAVAVLERDVKREPPRILDFGAADGELICRVRAVLPVNAVVYEPAASQMAEARTKLSGADGVEFTSDVASMASGSFDYVFCLEVLEHLPARQSDDALADIVRLLRPGGTAVIGVPHELHLPALLKGLFRMSRRHGEFDARVGNIWSAVLGRPPSPRPVAEIAPGLPFHFYHLGFDYRVLEKSLRERLQLERKWFSPFPPFGAALNSEVYFLLRKNARGLGC